MRRTVRAALAGALACLGALASAGCAPLVPGESTGPLVGDWLLLEAGLADAPLEVEGAGITLISDGASAAGFSGCSEYAFEVSGDSEDFRVGVALEQTQSDPATGALPACEESLERVESRYLAALVGADRAEIRDDGLWLTGADGTLHFEPIPRFPALRLADTEWVMLNQARTSRDRWATEVVGVPTLRFVGADRILAPLGCGGVVATYRVVRTEAFVTSLHRVGDEECVRAFSDRDRLLTQFLDGFRVSVVGGDRLVLTHEQLQLTYRAAESS